jgi:hypothetical protein
MLSCILVVRKMQKKGGDKVDMYEDADFFLGDFLQLFIVRNNLFLFVLIWACNNETRGCLIHNLQE